MIRVEFFEEPGQRWPAATFHGTALTRCTPGAAVALRASVSSLGTSVSVGFPFALGTAVAVRFSFGFRPSVTVRFPFATGLLDTGTAAVALHPSGRSQEFFFRDGRVFAASQSLQQSFHQGLAPFGDFVQTDLAVVVGIELLEELLGIPPTGSTGAAAAHALCCPDHIFFRQFVLAETLKQRIQERPGSFRNLAFRQFAVPVGVQTLEHFLRIRPPILTAGVASGGIDRTVIRFGGVLELVGTQFAVFILVTDTHQTLEEPLLLFLHLVTAQLTVGVFVQIFEELFGIGARLWFFIFGEGHLPQT